MREQLLALLDLEQSFSYCLLDTPIPMFNDVAHVRLLPVTDGDRTFWQWESRFTTRPGDQKRLVEMVGEEIYQAGSRPFASICARPHDRATADNACGGEDLRNAAEASSTLASDRSARFIGGGTLVMRALNEGDVGISTIVRLEERALSQILDDGRRASPAPV